MCPGANLTETGLPEQSGESATEIGIDIVLEPDPGEHLPRSSPGWMRWFNKERGGIQGEPRRFERAGGEHIATHRDHVS